METIWCLTTLIEGKSFWPYMLENNCIGIGWSKLGNLMDLDCRTDECFEARLAKAGYNLDEIKAKTRTVGEITHFLSSSQIGSVVLAQDEEIVQGIGLANDRYTFDESRPLAHQSSVVWKVISPNIVNPEFVGRTIKKLRNKVLIAQVLELLGDERWNVTHTPLQRKWPF